MPSPKDTKRPVLFGSAEQNALVEVLFASIGEGAIATDETGRIIRINDEAQHILGYSEDEALGEWFPRKIVAYDDALMVLKPIDRPITQSFLTGRAITRKMYYRQKNGQGVPVTVTVAPIILAGTPIGAINLFRDITAEYEVDRMKNEFISLASHQLRTPLSAIKTYTHMLVGGYMGKVTAEQRASLQTISAAVDRMNQLISTLLNVSRIEGGAVAVTRKRISLKALAGEVIKDMSVEASEHGVKLKLQMPTTPMNVRTDRMIMKEILINLMSNAIKYTPENGTATLALEQQKQKIICSVQDTGAGIPPASQDKIFSKFYRAPNAAAHNTEGTGLGLYLVKGLAERLGAELWFESKIGRGSTFYVSLPVNSISNKD